MPALRRALLGAAVLALAACASPYTPSADHTFEPIPEFTATGELALINGQPSTEEHNIVAASWRTTTPGPTWPSRSPSASSAHEA